MARIRTIKPEIWTDPDFTECSMSARLLFLASLNFASDYGVLADKPAQLKMQCLPGDPLDIHSLIDELVDKRFYDRTIAPDGAKVLVIRTFNEHQRVNRPNAGRWGNPAEWPQSVNAHGTLTESSPPEGKGREKEGNCPPLPIQTTDAPTDPAKKKKYQQAITHLANRRADKANPTNRANYIRTVETNVEHEHGDKLVELIDRYPTAPYDVIAAAIEGETRSLAYHTPVDNT
jgi:hypothetical protein